MLQTYSGILIRVLQQAKIAGQVSPSLDERSAATLFIGSIQGLVMQSLLAGDVTRMRRDAVGVFAIYLRGIGHVRSAS